jgi:acylphosphatase
MMVDENPVRLHAVVEGRVQGVGFRYFVVQIADELKLVGWVRNLDEGEVEVIAEGTRSRLETLLKALRRGPHSAFVSNVKVEWGEARGEFRRFGVIHSYE